MKHAQVLAGNIVQVEDIQVLEDLITLPDTLFLYTARMVPSNILGAVRKKVEEAKSCLGNIVLEQPKLREQASR